MAEVESMIELDCILNDFRGKPVALVYACWYSSGNYRPDALNLSVPYKRLKTKRESADFTVDA